MSKIIVWLSPKTAGASSVSLNAALLQKSLKPSTGIGFVEIASHVSQSVLFASGPVQDWGLLPPFLPTNEWQPDLLQRPEPTLGLPAWWAPVGKKSVEFDTAFAEAWAALLRQSFSTVHVDLSHRASQGWQQFWLEKADQVVAVVTPDPLNLSAWENWQSISKKQQNLAWVLNQVGPKEGAKLRQKFTDFPVPLVGTLRQEAALFWQQTYLGFPVVGHKKSAFKRDLYDALVTLKLLL